MKVETDEQQSIGFKFNLLILGLCASCSCRVLRRLSYITPSSSSESPCICYMKELFLTSWNLCALMFIQYDEKGGISDGCRQP